MDEVQRIIVEVQNTARIRELNAELQKEAELLLKVKDLHKDDARAITEGQQAIARNIQRNREEVARLQQELTPVGQGGGRTNFRQTMHAMLAGQMLGQAAGAIAEGDVSHMLSGGLGMAGQGALLGGANPWLAAGMMALGQLIEIGAKNAESIRDFFEVRDREQIEIGQKEIEHWKGVFEKVLKGAAPGQAGIAETLKMGMGGVDEARIAMELRAAAQQHEFGMNLNPAERQKIKDIEWKKRNEAGPLGMIGMGDWNRKFQEQIETIKTEAAKRVASSILEGVTKEGPEGREARRQLSQFLEKHRKEIPRAVVPDMGGLIRALKQSEEDFAAIEQKEKSLEFERRMFVLGDTETRRRKAEQGERDLDRQQWRRRIDDMAIGGEQAKEEARKTYGEGRIKLQQKLADLEELGGQYQKAISSSNNPAYQDLMLGRLQKIESMYMGLLRQLNRLNAAPMTRGQFTLQPFIW